MKNSIRLALISVSLVAGSYAAPFMAIGDGAELFVTGGLGVRADDNILLAKNAESDLVFEITPGIDLTFGKNAQVKGSLTLSDTFTNYSDNSSLNNNLFSGDFTTKYDDGKLKLGFNAGFHELSQNTADVRGIGRLTRRDVFNVGGDTEVEVSQITSISGGISFKHENYKPAGYTDSDELVVPVNFYYRWTPKVDLSVGYRYRDFQVDTLGSDSTDHFINVGARGEFTPKLTGKVAIGLNMRKLDGTVAPGTDKSKDDFGFDASLAYALSPKTTLQFGGNRDYGTSPQGQQQKNLTFNGSLTSIISDDWSVNAGASWRSIDYGTRTDDYWEFLLGATYIVNSSVRISGGYTYRNYSSDISTSEFKNNVFSISASFRY
eukprot:TRINITY_DN23833_c0_g1_i8.p1 TRINITY_DN23833_c0_g1~~TRINITY_DN23833_c0_g1_i8.p1  ORF type:complete len:377 (-),score=92.96 TRINITY_DN23833_c0_g1_i8:80-1210(-)